MPRIASATTRPAGRGCASTSRRRADASAAPPCSGFSRDRGERIRRSRLKPLLQKMGTPGSRRSASPSRSRGLRHARTPAATTGVSLRLHVCCLAFAAATLVACAAQHDDGDVAPTAAATPPAQVSPAERPGGSSAPGPAPAEGAGYAAGSLRVDRPAEGTVGFGGFGPARFGDSAEAVRQAWGGDLGDAQPSESGGCHYLIPQPLGSEGYRTAFMIEGDRFVRMRSE